MGVFEYIGVLVSVIMGLGITHLAMAATGLVTRRHICAPRATDTLVLAHRVLRDDVAGRPHQRLNLPISCPDRRGAGTRLS